MQSVLSTIIEFLSEIVPFRNELPVQFQQFYYSLAEKNFLQKSTEKLHGLR